MHFLGWKAVVTLDLIQEARLAALVVDSVVPVAFVQAVAALRIGIGTLLLIAANILEMRGDRSRHGLIGPVG